MRYGTISRSSLLEVHTCERNDVILCRDEIGSPKHNAVMTSNDKLGHCANQDKKSLIRHHAGGSIQLLNLKLVAALGGPHRGFFFTVFRDVSRFEKSMLRGHWFHFYLFVCLFIFVLFWHNLFKLIFLNIHDRKLVIYSFIYFFLFVFNINLTNLFQLLANWSSRYSINSVNFVVGYIYISDYLSI